MFRIFKTKIEDNVRSEIEIDMNNIPKHIAIIMDGNGRWAKDRNLPRSYGHKAGVEAIREVVRSASDIGVKYLTLYAFSTENWNRPKDEIDTLMKLLMQYMKSEFDELHKNNVVINTIGDITQLPGPCYDAIEEAKIKTRDNSGLVLNLALNYGGRAEILRSVQTIADLLIEKKISINDIDENLIDKYLYTGGMPDPDIIIRPSGEQRLSNFLLWQCAYSEFWYSDVKWPDFKQKDLLEAICDYQNRDRRFGKVK